MNTSLGEYFPRYLMPHVADNDSFRDRFSFRFLGVRYADQPERFTYSTPYSGNGSQVSALDYGSQCVQGGNVGSEDCLFLNIWTNHLPGPKSAKRDLKPVMVSDSTLK